MLLNRKSILLVLLLCGFVPLLAEDGTVRAPGVKAPDQPFVWRTEKNDVFGPGEYIEYVIKYGFIPGGSATLNVHSITAVGDREAYHIISRAWTNKTMSLIFKVTDRNESWIDTQSLCSLRFDQEIREGRYHRDRSTTYDHPTGTFVYWKRRKGKEYTRKGKIPTYVQDVLSSLYYLRTRELEVGGEYEITANSAGKTWPMKVVVKKRQRVRVPAGKFDCLRVEPFLVGEGIFKQKGRMDVWLTDDNRKIPVLLRSRVLVGAFDAEMKTYIPGE